MSHSIVSPKPLFLSEEEALALLDLCLLSPDEHCPVMESAVAKLADLARRYMKADIAAERAEAMQAVVSVEQPECLVSGASCSEAEEVAALQSLAERNTAKSRRTAHPHTGLRTPARRGPRLIATGEAASGLIAAIHLSHISREYTTVLI